MSGTSWDHNAWYHRTLLGQLPPGSRRVLDVGCGAGALARELATRVPQVDALDADQAMVALARRSAPANLDVLHADVLAAELPAGSYDAVLSSSVLHHLPLSPALTTMAGWLRPGGVLAAVTLPRVDLPRDLPVEAAAVLGHHGLGAVFAAGRRLTGRPLFDHEPMGSDMPMRDPELTTRQVRAAAAAVLPGVRVRRLLFWRFVLTWTKPFTG
ncbi:bifunctional 2-polyprenyl-6-hydroxyphenol methylase/3-demethylubiquinol 3-O-methyltransferase UbiG [uncultured Modestobacter sp.]|uniref:class I SAM-dependent methyltransferase n=1 Tax=uncultured Modestobacter sp. TaxID=380048 RepID=UPI0026307EB9|nr:class I SAM-dependent methyltransferase [uncultured Modestobacter sp.]